MLQLKYLASPTKSGRTDKFWLFSVTNAVDSTGATYMETISFPFFAQKLASIIDFPPCLPTIRLSEVRILCLRPLSPPPRLTTKKEERPKSHQLFAAG